MLQHYECTYRCYFILYFLSCLEENGRKSTYIRPQEVVKMHSNIR